MPPTQPSAHVTPPAEHPRLDRYEQIKNNITFTYCTFTVDAGRFIYPIHSVVLWSSFRSLVLAPFSIQLGPVKCCCFITTMNASSFYLPFGNQTWLAGKSPSMEV